MTPNNPVVAPKKVGVADMAIDPDKNFYGLYDRYYCRIRDFTAAIVKERWLAEDLTQETFIRAFKRIHALEDQSKVKAWLFRIAHNMCDEAGPARKVQF